MDKAKILVTGCAGHLGEALVRVLRAAGHEVVGLDILDSPFTTVLGSVSDRDLVRRGLTDVTGVIHAATLHKPHIASHDRRAFVDTNITGTLVLLEEAVAAGAGAFVFTSTTSAFGGALAPPVGAPAAWITEEVVPVPRNVYGVTKTAAEDLCRLVHQDHRLPVVVLRVARFFPEAADDADALSINGNVKANEFLYRRVDIEDAVDVHLLALSRAPAIGFATYVVSATSPFARSDVAALADDAPSVVRRLFPDQEAEYARRGWILPSRIDRVYVNTRARTELGWTPRHDFRAVLDALKADREPGSALARAVGPKGYHRSPRG